MIVNVWETRRNMHTAYRFSSDIQCLLLLWCDRLYPTVESCEQSNQEIILNRVFKKKEQTVFCSDYLDVLLNVDIERRTEQQKKKSNLEQITIVYAASSQQQNGNGQIQHWCCSIQHTHSKTQPNNRNTKYYQFIWLEWTNEYI